MNRQYANQAGTAGAGQVPPQPQVVPCAGGWTIELRDAAGVSLMHSAIYPLRELAQSALSASRARAAASPAGSGKQR